MPGISKTSDVHIPPICLFLYPLWAHLPTLSQSATSNQDYWFDSLVAKAFTTD